MSGKPDPVARVGSLPPAVVPAARLRTTTSFPRASASPGSRLKVPVGASKATTLPSALIAERSVVPFAWAPPWLCAARAVVPGAEVAHHDVGGVVAVGGEEVRRGPAAERDAPAIVGDVRVAEDGRVRLLAGRVHGHECDVARLKVLAVDVLAGVGVRGRQVGGERGEDDVPPVPRDRELDVPDVLGVDRRVRRLARGRVDGGDAGGVVGAVADVELDDTARGRRGERRGRREDDETSVRRNRGGLGGGRPQSASRRDRDQRDVARGGERDPGGGGRGGQGAEGGEAAASHPAILPRRRPRAQPPKVEAGVRPGARAGRPARPPPGRAPPGAARSRSSRRSGTRRRRPCRSSRGRRG